MKSAIDINGLSVVIDKKQILSDISLSIPEAQVIGLLGPSGAGKTTLIRAILGLQKPAAGNIEIFGLKAGSEKLKQELGYVTQAPSVYGDLTVIENLRYFGDLIGVGNRGADAVLHKVELQKYRDRMVESLSGGQRARVSLAAALLGNPKLLLLDEPTVGLDPVLRQKMWQRFKELAAAGTTILVSSHVMEEAEKCDSLIFMRHGRVLISDTRTAVLARTKGKSVEDAFLKLATGGSHEF